VKHPSQSGQLGEIDSALRLALAGLLRPSCELVFERLSLHYELMLSWGRRLNLTRITDGNGGAVMHYRVSLSVLPYLPDCLVVDIGSGAGFPGVPLATVLPEQRFVLVEPREKRASFLRVVVGRLGLTNVEVCCSRHDREPLVEAAAVVTRATFSSVGDLQACCNWLAPRGVFIAYRAVDSAVLPGAEIVDYELPGGICRRLELIRC